MIYKITMIENCSGHCKQRIVADPGPLLNINHLSKYLGLPPSLLAVCPS